MIIIEPLMHRSTFLYGGIFNRGFETKSFIIKYMDLVDTGY